VITTPRGTVTILLSKQAENAGFKKKETGPTSVKYVVKQVGVGKVKPNATANKGNTQKLER